VGGVRLPGGEGSPPPPSKGAGLAPDGVERVGGDGQGGPPETRRAHLRVAVRAQGGGLMGGIGG